MKSLKPTLHDQFLDSGITTCGFTQQPTVHHVVIWLWSKMDQSLWALFTPVTDIVVQKRDMCSQMAYEGMKAMVKHCSHLFLTLYRRWTWAAVPVWQMKLWSTVHTCFWHCIHTCFWHCIGDGHERLCQPDRWSCGGRCSALPTDQDPRLPWMSSHYWSDVCKDFLCVDNRFCGITIQSAFYCPRWHVAKTVLSHFSGRL